ncbi:hypothetical protein C7441_110199 [Pseudaminobacter salicylatoxidans]|uniref:Uncharacterized protein n=1 Tax=Pseudaminobacter salicylatoxidans TaxID=93369 RepID=A0A316C100_PSESE|nr:hypothetical protein [Pseudaminobacter salicylatoxidans]PWJ81662.1 hypothetical protein C7441_110199 [Pseudaminobacter salicylatoxidans]
MQNEDKSGSLATPYADGRLDRERRSSARIATDGQQRKLQEFAADVAIEFDFEDADLLYAFLVRMWLLMETGSAVAISNGKVGVPTDQPEFKSTHDRLERLRDHLAEAAAILREVPDNETLGAVLHHSDNSGAMDEHYEALLSLLETCNRAANLEGRAGRRPNEDWVRDFCVACQQFWLLAGKTGTAIVFHTAFPTPITRWTERVYVGLRRLKGLRDDLSKLKSTAKALSAYRG